MRKKTAISQAVAILKKRGDRLSAIQSDVLEGQHNEVWVFEHYVRDVASADQDEAAYCAARDAAMYLNGKIELAELIPDYQKYNIPKEVETSKMPSQREMWKTIQILAKRIDNLERQIQKPKMKIAENNTDTCTQREYNPLDASDYLLQAEAYLYIGCSLTTLKSWKNKGIIPFYRKKGRIYFKKSEIDMNQFIQRYIGIYK